MNAEQVLAARLALAALDPALARAHAAAPAFEWRVKAGGFAGLAGLVIEQQVSTASAAAIWKRLQTGLGEVTAQTVLAHDIEALRALGLSGQKARYVTILAEAQLSGALDFERLRAMDDDAAVQALTSLKGIGRWTAEAYLMGCEGRTDLFPAGDLALQEGLRLAEGAEQRLNEKALYARAEAWRPYRGVAAHLLWSYYTGVKRGVIGPAELT